MLTRSNFLINFWVSFLLLCLIYRITFFIEIFHSSLLKIQYALADLSFGLLDDLALSILLVLPLFLIRGFFLLALKRHQKWLKILREIGKVLLLILFILIAVGFIAQQKIFFILFTGCTYSLFKSAIQHGFTPDKYIYFLSYKNILALSLLVLIFCLLQHASFCRFNKQLKKFLPAFFLIAIFYGFYQIKMKPHSYAYFRILYQNPIGYALSDLLSPSENYFSTRLEKPGKAQMHSVRLIDARFTTYIETPPPQSIKENIPWNVVMVVLESAGLPYVFEAKHYDKIPMPFLQKLASQGMWLNNNYTGGNTSLLGGFSFLTGIYPSPKPDYFEMRSDIKIPSIASWLGEYDSFFVMAGDLNYFFQKGLIKNTGFKNVYDFNTIPSAQKNIYEDCSVNERDAVDFFLTRLQQAKPPFLAVYWSGATHYPYHDYGQPYRISDNVQNSFARYLNGLFLIDQQIKRIYQELQAKNLLDSTILVILGDHGEAFGKHPDGWVHGKSIYQEQIKVPVLFYQPKLFKPEIINRLTSNIDVLPTLFYAMSRPFDVNLLQGEPLQKVHLSRKYVFVYGDENELASIDKNNIKMQISFQFGTCVYFDLNNDPDELNPQKCLQEKQQLALIHFRNYQPEMLNWYQSKLLIEKH